MQGFRIGGGGWVPKLTPHVPAWEGKGKALDMDGRGYGGRERTSDISDRVPQGGDEGVFSGRFPREGRYMDGDAGASGDGTGGTS